MEVKERIGWIDELKGFIDMKKVTQQKDYFQERFDHKEEEQKV